ncbi:MAG: UvrD-helicase domain-containing protein [Patescibacteria group bacterium]
MELNPRQLEAIEHKNGPLLIVAGAGSGKTKTLTGRLVKFLENGIHPENIIAITFTNKAANEMKSRAMSQMSASEPFIGTFHSLGARILKNEAKSAKRTAAFTIFDEDDALSLIKTAMKSLDISKEQCNPTAVRGQISSVKNELLDPEEYLDKRGLAIFKKYEELLIQNNGFDFDDLIEKVVWLFKNEPEILKKYQKQFQYILVDEYQDVNTSQYQFVKLLAQEHKNLSVVGDDAQSIYAFRGSDFRNFLNFESDWPAAKVVKLEQNYRSTGNIITAASEVIKNNKFQKPKELWTNNEAGGLIKVIETSDAEQEAGFVADTINQQTTNDKQPTMAILYRTNAQSRAIEQELIVNQIPYKIFGGLKFYERKEIKDIVAALRVAFNPRDGISAERLAKTLPKETAKYLCQELPRLGKELSILQLINFFLENGNYFEFLDKKFKNSRERVENINELIVFASEFKDLSEFLERVSLLQSVDSPKSNVKNQASNVNLMTVHLAKGLEFDNVFVIGCSESLLPHQMSCGSQDDLEEERRLMYVAMTRAKNKLCLSFYNLPSRFLYEIPPELTEFISLGNKHRDLPDEEEIYIE